MSLNPNAKWVKKADAAIIFAFFFVLFCLFTFIYFSSPSNDEAKVDTAEQIETTETKKPSACDGWHEIPSIAENYRCFTWTLVQPAGGFEVRVHVDAVCFPTEHVCEHTVPARFKLCVDEIGIE